MSRSKTPGQLDQDLGRPGPGDGALVQDALMGNSTGTSRAILLVGGGFSGRAGSIGHEAMAFLRPARAVPERSVRDAAEVAALTPGYHNTGENAEY